MPKLANSHRLSYSHTAEVIDFRHTGINYKRYNSQTLRSGTFRDIKKSKKTKAKKKNIFQFLISLSVLWFALFYAMPYSFKHVTCAMFAPTPYKAVQTDMYDLSFPTYKYLSNTWIFGHRGFGFSTSGKKAQMVPLKENVNMPVLRHELMSLMEEYVVVKPAVYVWDYETGNYVDINASKSYATASIIKIPVLIDVFKSIEAGQFSLSDTIPLTEYYRTEGSGSIQFKARNTEYTIDKLAELMITESDNSATNMLMAKVGSMTDVNQSIRAWGLRNTKVQTWLPDLSGTNRTTAREMAQMLYNIDENDKFLTEESRSRMLNYMGHVHNNRLIQAGLGAGSVFLHKTGDIGTMLGDAGIVIAPNGRKYIVVILANRPHNSVAGKDFIVRASEIIYNYMVK